jgi:hypothetical protein
MGYYPAQLEMPPPIEGEEKIINPPVEELKVRQERRTGGAQRRQRAVYRSLGKEP